MKKKVRKSPEKQKISAMVLKVAEDYIDMGETVEEREDYLRSACTAWNIACLPPLKRESEIRRYIDQYRIINRADDTDCGEFEENIRLLIKQKDRLYPDIKVQIVGSKIEHINGHDHVTVVSARVN